MRENDNEILDQRDKVVETVSKKVSDINRVLNLSGIGIIWLFVQMPMFEAATKMFLIALLFYVGSILVEYFHYLMTIYVNWKYGRRQLRNKGQTGKKNFKELPNFTIAFPWVLWCIKIVLTFIAYIIVGIVLFKTIL